MIEKNCLGCRRSYHGRPESKYHSAKCYVTHRPLVFGKKCLNDQATLSPTLLDIAWASGIYEGEGYAGLSGSNKHSTRVIVVQVGRWLPLRLQSLFGGRISGQKVYKQTHNQTWHWQISGARARGFLTTIYAFLSPRRKEQARKALGLS